HGLRAGFRRAGDTTTRLADWVHADDYGPIVAALDACRRTPNAEVTVGARVKHDEEGWHVMTLAFRNLLDHPDVQGMLVRANDDRVRRLLESSNDIVVVIDERGLLTYCSPAAVRVLGRRPEDHVGRPVYELLHPDDVSWVSELISLAVQYPGPFPPEQLRVKHA